MAAIITLSLLAILILYMGLYKANRMLLPTSLLGFVLAIFFLVKDWHTVSKPSFSGMIFFDHYAVAFSILCILITGVILTLSKGYFNDLSDHIAEYYALIIFSLTGAIVVTAYHNLAMLFMGIEIMSVALYILVGIRKKDFASNEAALKYFLMGAFSTGFLLFGIALLYGASGSFDLEQLRAYALSGNISHLFYAGILLLTVGLIFKVGAAPFHFWTADVYDGAPLLITSYMSTVVKAASFAALLRLFAQCFAAVSEFWIPIFIAIAILTLFIGNISAFVQSSFKRMLAYSSISHAGYLLFALIAMGASSANGILIYITAYSLATVTAFAALIVVKKATGSDHIESFNGLAKRNPILALLLSIAMLSLAGIPLTAGFIGKFLMFSAVMKEYHIILLILAVINAAIAVCYYLRVVVAMYFKSQEESKAVPIALNYQAVFVILTLLTLLLGLYPNCILDLI